MPLLPNAATVIVPLEKVLDFLLNPNHPDNKGRARLFVGLGYSREDWQVLAAHLREQALTWDAIEVPSEFGRRFQVHGMLHGPKGSRPLRTVWEIGHGGDAAIFVTAYPRRRL